MSEFLDLDDDQRRILQLRLSSSGIGGVQGPPGTGKSLGMACEALRSVDKGQAPVVIAAFGNKTVDHVVRYARSLHMQAGGTEASFKAIACLAGYTPAISDDLLSIHSNDMLRISRSKLVFSTLHSSWRAAHAVSAERIILDETAQARPEQGFEVLENTTMDLTQNIPITVVGDDMQARPLSPGGNEFGILSRLKRSMPNSVHMLTTLIPASRAQR